MYQPNRNRFREDLVIVLNVNSEDDSPHYLVQNPSSKQVFEFEPEEIYICQLMNGITTPNEIIRRFENKFKYRLEMSEFKRFTIFLAQSNLLEAYQPRPVLTPANYQQDSTRVSAKTADDKLIKNYLDYAQSLVPKFENQENQISAEKVKEPYKFPLFDPNLLFKSIASVIKPFDFLFSIWLWLPIVILAILTLLNNFPDFTFDLNLFIKDLPFFQRLALSLVVVNLSSKIVQGIEILLQGGKVNEFGCKLEFGFFPLFYIDKQGIKKLSRPEKLHIFSAPLIYRLTLFSLCILTWFLTRPTQSGLTTLALIFSQSSMIGLLIDLSPFWKSSNGYLWLTTYFNIYRLYDRAMQVGAMTLAKRPLPQKLSAKEKTILYVYAILFILLVVSIILSLGVPIAILLENELQGTGVVIFVLLLALIIKWYYHESSK